MFGTPGKKMKGRDSKENNWKKNYKENKFYMLSLSKQGTKQGKRKIMIFHYIFHFFL